MLYYIRDPEEHYVLCVPAVLTSAFVDYFHDRIGHFGAYKTWAAMKRETWWSNMYRDIKKRIRSCEICQKTKQAILARPEIHPVVPNTKSELVALDLYGPLPKSRGGASYVLVVLDVFSKYVALYALKRATTRSCLNRLVLEYFPKFGRPKRILSDHGTQFTAKSWKTTLTSLGIDVSHC